MIDEIKDDTKEVPGFVYNLRPGTKVRTDPQVRGLDW